VYPKGSEETDALAKVREKEGTDGAMGAREDCDSLARQEGGGRTSR